MNMEQQKFTSSETEHINLDFMGRQIEARVQVRQHTVSHVHSKLKISGELEYHMDKFCK